MRRNYKEEIHKHYKRLSKKYNELWDQSREMTYIPLEKPQFAGWEIYVGLTESGARRRDVDEIRYMIDYLQLSKPVFIRNVSLIKHVRKYNNSYTDLVKYYDKLGSHWTHWNHHHINDWIRGRVHITEKEYKALPEKYAKHFYFNEYKNNERWNAKGNIYSFQWLHFPKYELMVKVKKSYWSKRGIPNSEAQSEYQKIRSKLEHYCWWSKIDEHNDWWGVKDILEHRSVRRGWNIHTTHAKYTANNLIKEGNPFCDNDNPTEEDWWYYDYMEDMSTPLRGVTKLHDRPNHY